MPKSKTSIKRRGKAKRKSINKSRHKSDFDNSFNKPYMKTDGESRVCKYDQFHNFLGYATEEESKNF